MPCAYQIQAECGENGTSRDIKSGNVPVVGMEDIVRAHHVLREVIVRTPLQRDAVLSAKYNCEVYLKREDLQVVRSFKIRGAYNMIRSLSQEERERGLYARVLGTMRKGLLFHVMPWEFRARSSCQAQHRVRRLSR